MKNNTGKRYVRLLKSSVVCHVVCYNLTKYESGNILCVNVAKKYVYCYKTFTNVLNVNLDI